VSGTLYLVATPIGHLGDITRRAVDTLQQVDFVACEDTRHTGRLLQHLGLKKALVRCDDHTEKHVARSLANRVARGEHAALVTDAGTPGVADPGYAVVQAMLAREITVVPIPGPSALLAALAASGLPTHAFRFEGFLPVRSGPRRRLLLSLREDDATQIFYVPPHKLNRWLGDMLECWGDRPACLAREVTKKFEEFIRRPLSELVSLYAQRRPRGEMVLLVAGRAK
jgi:16S rRNA (cytidine1402-2'-O)-methyltransferase